MQTILYMTPFLTWRNSGHEFEFEGTKFVYTSLPEKLIFTVGQARLILIKDTMGILDSSAAVWIDGIKIGHYTDTKQIKEPTLRMAVELGLRALAAESARIEAESKAERLNLGKLL
jgi:hypothetical protein